MLKIIQWFRQWFQRLLNPPRRRQKKRRGTESYARTAISWVIPGKLAVGGSPKPGDSVLLSRVNVKVVFSLCANSEEALPEDVTRSFHCLRLVLPDSHYKTEIKISQLAAAVDIIQHSIQNQLPIYVHCLAGVERSPTVCIAYLCRYYNLELWEAVNWLKQVHPYSMPSESQIRAVRHYISQELPSQKGTPPWVNTSN